MKKNFVFLVTIEKQSRCRADIKLLIKYFKGWQCFVELLRHRFILPQFFALLNLKGCHATLTRSKKANRKISNP